MLGDQQQRLHRGLPSGGIVFCLGQFGDVERSVAEGEQRFPARYDNRIKKLLMPRHKLTLRCVTLIASWPLA